MAVPTGNAAKVVTFKGFKRCFEWQAWHFVTFAFQESLCVTGTILLHRFQKMISKFRGQAQHFRPDVLRAVCQSR